jgi:exopolyphosphatase/guanosine-5'-triphosphate,3'-diphosphate pyrophosphatase
MSDPEPRNLRRRRTRLRAARAVAGDDHRPRHDGAVRVGVVDVGSNTVRLLVADGDEPVEQRRAVLGLGESIERAGAIPERELAGVADCVAGFVAGARAAGAERIEVLVTSPGRQAANGDELLERLAATSRVPVRLLSAAEEGRLAFLGAVSRTGGLGRETVAVCDVGGGSAQVTIGTVAGGAAWTRSIDVGSRRLASRCLDSDPPGAGAMIRARSEVSRLLSGFAPPPPQAGLAVGGSARSLRALVGPSLGRAELEHALSLLADTPADELASRYELDPGRTSTLPAGAAILAVLQGRLGIPLRVGRGGVREGAVLELAARRAAA